jgi:hypothetical protein
VVNIQPIISKACIYFNNLGFDWSICGGGAIDLFLGKKTRVHKDLDIAVYWEDRNAIISLMLDSGWRVFEACGGGVIHELFDKQDIPFEKRNLFCFTTNETRCSLEPIGENKYRFGFEKKEQDDFNYVEFLFNKRDDEYFYLPSKPNLKRSLNKAIIKSNDVPFLSPEIVLFYKSSYLDGPDTNDHSQDFTLTLPLLDLEQKQWLRGAIEKEHSNDHVWLQRL